jgi:hypothetical protein
MKKIKYARVASGLLLFVIIISIFASAVVAWGNGRLIGYKIGNLDETNPIPIYYNDFRFPMGDTPREYYSTHDWVAESALELLYDKKLHVFLSMLQGDPITNNMLKIYFLFGTEIPDRLDLPAYFTTDLNYPFQRNEFPPASRHTKLHYYINGHPKPDSDLIDGILLLYGKISYAFKLKDCQAAAVFIGALMHLITDATMYNHLLPNIPHMKSLESLVAHLTFRKWERDGTREIDPPGITEFFSVKQAKNRITEFTNKDPQLQAMIAGRDTAFGYDYGYYPETGVFNALEMSQVVTTRPNRGYWDMVDGPIGAYLTPLNTWRWTDRPTGNSDLAKYFNTIEHSLNTAIYHSAQALNYILDNAGFVGCSGTGENPPQDSQDRQGQKDRTAIQVKMDQFMGLVFFNMAGLFATGMALTIMTQVDLIKKILGIFA